MEWRDESSLNEKKYRETWRLFTNGRFLIGCSTWPEWQNHVVQIRNSIQSPLRFRSKVRDFFGASRFLIFASLKHTKFSLHTIIKVVEWLGRNARWWSIERRRWSSFFLSRRSPSFAGGEVGRAFVLATCDRNFRSAKQTAAQIDEDVLARSLNLLLYGRPYNDDALLTPILSTASLQF